MRKTRIGTCTNTYKGVQYEGVVSPSGEIPDDFIENKDCGDYVLKKMNKLELRGMEFIAALGYHAIPQPVRLFPLPGGGTYTPDFIGWKEGECPLVVFECKEDGAWYKGSGQGLERYARVATIYDGKGPFRFVKMTWFRKEKRWHLDWWGGEKRKEGEEEDGTLQAGRDLLL